MNFNLSANYMHKRISYSHLNLLQLARFADSILKKSQRNLSESEQEERMADIVSVYHNLSKVVDQNIIGLLLQFYLSRLYIT